MNYTNGKGMRLGDEIAIEKDCTGIVVCIFDSGEFQDDFPKSEWEYLKEGFLVDSPQLGLIHYHKMSDEIKFIKRKEDTS